MITTNVLQLSGKCALCFQEGFLSEVLIFILPFPHALLVFSEWIMLIASSRFTLSLDKTDTSWKFMTTISIKQFLKFPLTL